MKIYKGITQKGVQHGTKLGFPTVNIPLRDTNVSGIYAARVHISDTGYIAAVFADQKRKLLEAHLLDFSHHELYGKDIEIELYEKIRDSMEFKDEEKLRAAITDDIAKVRAFFQT